MNRITEYPAIFIGQEKPHIVQSRSFWRINNTFSMSHEYPIPQDSYENMAFHSAEKSELEKMYHEFLEKAYRYLRSHRTFNGTGHSRRIIFPDFKYDVIEEKFPIK